MQHGRLDVKERELSRSRPYQIFVKRKGIDRLAISYEKMDTTENLFN